MSVLFPWRRAPFPVPWHEAFGRAPGPLHVEVGFGDGRYTVRRAQEEPEASFVGLEIASASLQRAARKIRALSLGNVLILKLGAAFAVRHLFAPASVGTVTVNFPDPWPKARHAKNRLLQRHFFELAASRLLPGGEIRLATDHPDYLAFAVAEAEASGLFELHYPNAPPAVFETKYAQKWKTLGKPLYYCVFAYTGSSAPEFPILERPHEMPHALLHGALPDPRTVRFGKQVVPYGGAHVILHELAESLGGEEGARRWLLRATIDEPDLQQQLLVVIKPRGDEEVIVRLEPFGDPVITPATRGAVHAATEWLLSQTGLRLTARNY